MGRCRIGNCCYFLGIKFPRIKCCKGSPHSRCSYCFYTDVILESQALRARCRLDELDAQVSCPVLSGSVSVSRFVFFSSSLCRVWPSRRLCLGRLYHRLYVCIPTRKTNPAYLWYAHLTFCCCFLRLLTHRKHQTPSRQVHSKSPCRHATKF